MFEYTVCLFYFNVVLFQVNFIFYNLLFLCLFAATVFCYHTCNIKTIDVCTLTTAQTKGGSPRGNDTGGINGVGGPGGVKGSKTGRGRGRASGASPRGRSPHIESDILGGRATSS